MATPQPTFAFTKMQGAGNDFILFDNRTLKMSDGELTRLAPVFCNRKFGIGSDGIIALNYDDTQQADLVMNYKNPDGSDAGMCGNGARCFAAFAATLGCPEQFSFRVHNHVYRANIRGEQVTIHFPLETTVEEMIVEEFNVLNVYTNTEHVVCPVQPEVLENESRLITDGRFFRYHDDFQPKGTNVNFISGTDRNQLSLQTYERGVENLTLACGTGAIASALAWHHLQQGSQGDHRFTVKVRGGLLQIHFSFNETNQTYSNIQLEGPATFVFEGQFYL